MGQGENFTPAQCSREASNSRLGAEQVEICRHWGPLLGSVAPLHLLRSCFSTAN